MENPNLTEEFLHQPGSILGLIPVILLARMSKNSR